MKIEKTIVLGLIVANLYNLLRDALIVGGIIDLYDYSRTANIFLSFMVVAMLLVAIDNTYWMLASIFTGLNSAARIIAAHSNNVHHNVSHYSVVISLPFGMLCSLASAYCFFRVLQIGDFSFRDYKYSRIARWNKHLKDKFGI